MWTAVHIPRQNMDNEKRKQSLYFHSGMLAEIQAEARRLDRSYSWVIQRAWMIARDEIKKLPSLTWEAGK